MATFVEYAMLVGLMAIIIAVAVAKLGGNVFQIFDKSADITETVKGYVGEATIANPATNDSK